MHQREVSGEQDVRKPLRKVMMKQQEMKTHVSQDSVVVPPKYHLEMLVQ